LIGIFPICYYLFISMYSCITNRYYVNLFYTIRIFQRLKFLESLFNLMTSLDYSGTLVQGAFMDRKCGIGLILGTGSNACYIEKADRIKKWEGEHTDVEEVGTSNKYVYL